MQVLDAAERSLRSGGKKIYLQDPKRTRPAKLYQEKLMDSLQIQDHA